MDEALLVVQGLKKYFPTPRGMLHAVDDVSFSIQRSQTFGVVGESGCGKSTLGRTILRLVEPTAGHVRYAGRDLGRLSRGELKALRRQMQIIFQDPFSSLDPRLSVAEAIREPLVIHGKRGRKHGVSADRKVKELMEQVGLAERLTNAYPHELDGGRRQRIGIARALALDPEFIVCDEPVSALDVSIQAQILNLLQDIQQERNLTYMFISHDLAVVKHISTDIAVMYLGEIIEQAPCATLFSNARHPYTNALLSAIPIPDPDIVSNRMVLKGEVTSPINPGRTCRFALRCAMRIEICDEVPVPLTEIEKDHLVRCHLWTECEPVQGVYQ